MLLQSRPFNLVYLPCYYFYRNKPHEYFNNIFCYEAGIINVYRKNKNGDPASPINGQLHGRTRLKQLDNFQNPFLYFDLKSQTVWVTTRGGVQVFFSENIYLHHVMQNGFGFMEDVPSQPVPETTVEGVPKNPLCPYCNIN